MKKIKIFVLCFAFFSISSVSAEENKEKVENSREFNHGVGIAAGFVTGYGLSYRYLTRKYILQFTFAPYIEGENATISTGAAILKNIYIGDTSKLFAYSGVHYWYHKYTEKISEDDVVLKGQWTDKWLNIGIGPGFEFSLTNNVVLDIMAGYAVYVSNTSYPRLNFTGEAALYFYFE